MSLLPIGVPQDRQDDAGEKPRELAFELTLVETPPLPISLARQISFLLRKRSAASHPDIESPLPVLDMRPWFFNLPEQIRSLLMEPGMAPKLVTSLPVVVPDIWQDYRLDPSSWANSLLVHLFVLTALLLPFELQPLVQPASVPKKLFDLTPLVFALPQLHGQDEKTGGGGGGGVRSPLPASRGALPPFARTQFTPPSVMMPKVTPILAMQPTLLGPPELKLPEMKLDMPWGDPKGVVGPPSGGPGEGGGIGLGEGTGVGPGKGPGYGPGSDGGCCGGAFSVGGEVSAPIPIYSPEPAYSEEARKAKFAGTVILWIVVDAQGTVRNMRVAKPLGMGLDEEAKKTVSTWKFKPALRHGVPVPVQMEVEVIFRLF